MGLQDMVRWLLPREDKFYGLIERQGVLLDEAAKALAELAGPALPAEVHEKVREIEHRADAIVYEIEEQLAAVFVTPIDREDIQLLASALDDIIDYINLTARTFVLFGVARPTPPMVAMMEVLVKMAEFLRAELPALRTHQYTRLIAAGQMQPAGLAHVEAARADGAPASVAVGRQQQHGRCAHHAEAHGQFGLRVDVDRGQCDAGMALGEGDQDRVELLAGAAPLGPEVDEHGLARLEHVLLERGVGRLGEGHAACSAVSASWDRGGPILAPESR